MSSLPLFLRRTSSQIVAAVAGAVILGLLAFLIIQSQSRLPDFSMRQRVSAHADLHFSFPESMDRRSVEALMIVPKNLEGNWSWEGGVLVFHPTTELKAAATYMFHVPRSALKSSGEPLGKDLDFTFTVSGPPRLAARIPMPGARMVESKSHITLIFDRPMVSLTQVQSEESFNRLANWPVTITPKVEGSWHWLSTVAVAFIPKNGLLPSTKYTIHVPAGIKTVIGDSIEHDIDWSFETIRPEVSSTTPEMGYSLAGPTTQLSFTFNQDMDPARARDHILLYASAASGSQSVFLSGSTVVNGKPVAIREFTYGTKVVDEKKMTDTTTLVLHPQVPLAFETNYLVYTPRGLRARKGDLGSESGSSLTFGTVGAFTVQSDAYVQGQVDLNFSNPIDPQMLAEHVTFFPALGSGAVSWSVNSWSDSRAATAYPQVLPSTTYKVTIDTAMSDTYGQHLKKPYTFSFKTEPVPSKVFIHSKGEFGIFERGKAPVYYLNDVNVKTMDVEFAKLSLSSFLSMRDRSVSSYGQDNPGDLTVQEGYQSWTLAPGSALDKWKSTPFDVEKRLGRSLAPGIYALWLSSPQYMDDYRHQRIVERQYFVITNIALTLKYSGDHALVWAVDMETGKPISDADITFHALSGKSLLTGKTDAQGFLEVPIDLNAFVSAQNNYEPEFWVTAEKNGDFTFVSSTWNDGIRPNNFDFSTDFHTTYANSKNRIDAYFYTERPLYHAGDTVHFKGIMRLRDWNGVIRLPGTDTTVTATAHDPNGNAFWSQQLTLNEFGSMHADIPIDTKAALGDYSLDISVAPSEDSPTTLYGANFSVLAYRKPEYKVDLTTDAENYFNHQTVKATINGAYYFGAPMSSAHVTWRATTTDYFFNKFTDGWYSFALEDAWCWYNCNRTMESVMQGEGTLDDAGHMTINVPVDIDSRPISQVLTIEADITDQNNQSVSNRVDVFVHKANLYVGVRTEDYVVMPGQEAKIGIVTVHPDGAVARSQAVRVQLFSRTWNSIRKKGVDGEYYYDNDPVDTLVREQSATTNEQGKVTTGVLIPSGGEYRIVVIAKDNEGRETKAGSSLYSFSSTYINWPHSNTDRIDVLADKPEYKVGDIAKILVKSPFQGKGVKALLTVERDQIITKRVIDIKSNAESIDIPITENLLPTAYVSVVIIKPRVGETFNENGLDTGAPAYKIGYAKLNIDTTPKRMTIDIRTDKEQYLPQGKVTVTLTTRDSTGKPVPAELSLGTVDMSLLALSGFEMPDLVKDFYSERGLGVYTSQMLSFLLERFKPGSKGGGGGDAGETSKRGEFKDTAYWNPSVITDMNGKATLTFTLPDNLTTWQLLAIGSTKAHTYGATAKTIVETKRVIVRPVRPRFAVHGDTVELGAIVHNFLPTTESFTVTLAGSGFTPSGSSKKTVTVASGQQEKILFPVVVQPVNAATFIFKAETAGAVDEIEETIPVYPFGTLQTSATTGIVESIAVESVHVPAVSEASTGSLTAVIAPTMATYLPGGLSYLLKYPYGCAEQTVSAFLPSVALKTLQGFDAFKIADNAALNNIVVRGLERVYTFQRSDGGFGYFTESPESYPYLSAYVLYALHRTQLAGYTVDQSVIERDVTYLNSVLREKTTDAEIDRATRAYILYALSEMGRADGSLLNNLYPDRAKLPLFAQAQLAMAYQNLAGGERSNKARGILEEIVQKALIDGRGTHFEEGEDDSYYSTLMHTNERTTAIVLHALIRLDPANPLIPNVIRYLLSVRNDGHWDTTQSTVETLLALTEYLKSTHELEANFTAGILINGKKALDWTVTKKNILDRAGVTQQITQLLRGQDNEVKIGKEGKGRLYYDLIFSTFATADHIQPAEEGISIRRTLTPLSGQKKTVTVGNLYDVTLTITVPEDRHFVAVESPVPAGMEIVDQKLQTSQKSLFANDVQDLWSEDYWQSGLWHFSHTEMRDDEAFLFADHLPTGVYQYHYIVRATTPGTYRYRPARAFEMYFPEIFGQTDGDWFTIKE